MSGAGAGAKRKPRDGRTAGHGACLPGRGWPMGAHWDGQGVNFAVFSAHAQAIELCLFDPPGERERERIVLPGRSGDVWHGYLPGAQPGLVYGFRASGPWRPDRGHRFDDQVLLLDPCAREIVGATEGWPARQAALACGQGLFKARVVHEARDAHAEPRPCHAAADLVIYELHVKGFTRLHPQIPAPLRGTYAGLAHPAALEHLRRLGVTAVNLLPVHQHLDERRLVERGLVNYWGYNTLGFYCPEPRYASVSDAAGVREEFRAMVRALHRAGIEVILDVVYNHTCESDEAGPTLSWRGLDNAAWYRHHHDAPDRYVNDTGCGNTLDLRHPRVLQFVMDSLRFWVADMGVDGFRFDLATVLARGDHGFDPRAPLFAAIAQDPVLAGTGLIAEPWDVGPDGYRLGGFPNGWLEWNDRYRDDMRGWWLGGTCTPGAFAQRLCASADVFHHQHRPPSDSLNYVVSHDGFTLRDLVSYRHRHNEANGEENRDGHAHNASCNFGTEGPCDDPAVNARRDRASRALLATLMLSQGTPMLAAGDELGHSQNGNNNPYCQDNPTTWIDWSRADHELIGFCARLLRLRREWRPLDVGWYDGAPDADGRRDLAWLSPEGGAFGGDAWSHDDARCLGALIGDLTRGPRRREPPCLLIVNAGPASCAFALPPGPWRCLFDSGTPTGEPDSTAHADHQDVLEVPAATLLVLAREAPDGDGDRDVPGSAEPQGPSSCD